MTTDYGIALFPQHAKLRRESAITPEVAWQRNYQSVDTKSRLDSIDIPKAHRLVPGLLIWPSELDAFTRNGAEPKAAPYVPPAAQTLNETTQAFDKWLRLDDKVPVLVVAATMAANLAVGRPLWLLVVAPASSGKTEIAGTIRELPYVHVVSELTKSALLSGTNKRDRSTDATGGLMRQVSDFGVLLAKDFTSVLTQNKDARGEALSALREIADGYWVRPLGADGGRVLEWSGKCGFIGCVTPAIDRYHAVLSALGDRYLVVRLPSDDAPEQTALRALSQNSRETDMHRELSDAMCGLIVGADLDRVNRPLAEWETAALIRLAVFTARARTGVDRDGYSQELLYLPQPEGPGRLISGMRRLFGGLEAIGCDAETAWDVVARVSVDCMPAARTRLARELLHPDRVNKRTRTTELAEAVGMVTKTAHRHLDDMALLGLAVRTKTSDADNAPDFWQASPWLREHWPKSGTEILPQHPEKIKKENSEQGAQQTTNATVSSLAPLTPNLCPTLTRHPSGTGHDPPGCHRRHGPPVADRVRRPGQDPARRVQRRTSPVLLGLPVRPIRATAPPRTRRRPRLGCEDPRTREENHMTQWGVAGVNVSRTDHPDRRSAAASPPCTRAIDATCATTPHQPHSLWITSPS